VNKAERGEPRSALSIMLTFTDTHCHLNFDAFEDDLPDVLQNALENSLDRIMLPGTDVASSQLGIKIAQDYPQCYAAVGIHPNDAKKWTNESLSALRQLAQNQSKVLAIGEIGLDYYRDWSTPEQQNRIFLQQLDLAKELQLPVIIHIREALEDTFRILFQWQTEMKEQHLPLADRPGVLHAFPGNLEEAMQGVQHHFKIGVGGPVTFKNAKERQIMVQELPLDAIVLETDAPFLTPHPHRGKRNEPAYIPLIAEKIAALKGIPIGRVSEITTQNAYELFHW